MSLFHRKSRLERAVDVALPLLEARMAASGTNGNGGAARRHTPSAPVKKGLAAVGGVAGVAAGSAALSALRQRSESSKGDG